MGACLISSVESGVVSCFCQKDYELESWNEQGEITKVEGMLTICFSYISSCSHIGNRKELYLIVKIPYTVSMFTEQKLEPKKVELQPVNLLKAFHEQRQPEALMNVYKKQLQRFYPADGIVPIEIRTLEYNAPIYYLVFAATHPLAKKIHSTFEDWIRKKRGEFRKEGFALKLIAEAKRKQIKSLDEWV